MAYTHVLNRGGRGVRSPADCLGATVNPLGLKSRDQQTLSPREQVVPFRFPSSRRTWKRNCDAKVGQSKTNRVLRTVIDCSPRGLFLRSLAHAL